jgi:hypothetical protein
LDGILGDFYINYDNYCVSFIEIGQTNDILWMHGKFFCIFEGWEGAQDGLEWFEWVGKWHIICTMCVWQLPNMQFKIPDYFSLIVMKSKLLITKARFPSMVMWLKIGGGCTYFWICKGSLKEASPTTSLPCDEFCPCFWGIHIQVGLLWCGWCDRISRFKDRGDSVAHWKNAPLVIGIDYTTHRYYNLAMQTLSRLLLIGKVEALL